MKYSIKAWGVLLVILHSFLSCGTGPEDHRLPNIIYILADDLGYGELGCFGQTIIETLHLDTLAALGMRFTQHYSGAPVCAPARCVLLTGMHSGHAYIRGNDEWGSRGLVWDYDQMFANPHLEGQRPLPDSIELLPEMLKRAGYRTGMVGKWGLGAPHTMSIPNEQGFDYFLGYNCQRQAHTLYPRHLWLNRERKILANRNVPIHANLAPGADPSDPASYADFRLQEYAPTVMHEGALQFIEESEDEPFFLYYASPIPHVPLQAPAHWVKYYQEKIGPEEPHTENSYFPCLAPRATYAAMISYLDEQVGDLVALLKKQGRYENTIIIFSSDNGPSFTGGTDSPYFESAGPFRSDYGWGKGFVHEGGIRVPMIVSWPEKIRPNQSSNHISGFQDVMPTLADIVQVAPEGKLDGISFLPELLGEEQVRHDFLYWEFPSYGGQQAIRQGNFKAIRKDILRGNLDIDLYNLKLDPREQSNIADDHPGLIETFDSLMSVSRSTPLLDRFMLEALGDVKVEAKAARARQAALKNVVVRDKGLDYFTISRQTTLHTHPLATAAVEELQQRLRETGNYRLAGQNKGQSAIIFQLDTSLDDQDFKLEIDESQLEVKASSSAGFTAAVQVLLSCLDAKILGDHVMHNPRWLVSAASITRNVP